MEAILVCARVKAHIDELERKRALDMNRFYSYASRREKEIVELEHALRKLKQERDLIWHQKTQPNDERNEFMSNAYGQTFAKNIQLRDWLNTTKGQLDEKSSELKGTQKRFEEYKKQAVENTTVLIDLKKKAALENEQLRLQLAELVRPKDEKAVLDVLQKEYDFKYASESLDNSKMEKESPRKTKKSSKKQKRESRKNNKGEKSSTGSISINTDNVMPSVSSLHTLWRYQAIDIV